MQARHYGLTLMWLATFLLVALAGTALVLAAFKSVGLG
jgi:hypothetical protein